MPSVAAAVSLLAMILSIDSPKITPAAPVASSNSEKASTDFFTKPATAPTADRVSTGATTDLKIEPTRGAASIPSPTALPPWAAPLETAELISEEKPVAIFG